MQYKTKPTTLEAEHGLQVLQLLEKQPIGAVLYDNELPGLNAKEFLMLRQNNPIFYALLGYSHTEYEALGIDYLDLRQEGEDELTKETPPVMTSETVKKKPEGRLFHRQLKTSEHITIDW